MFQRPPFTNTPLHPAPHHTPHPPGFSTYTFGRRLIPQSGDRTMAAPHVQAEPSVKLEAGTKQEPGLSSSDIKTEPGFKTEPGYADDDELYEDAGDLDVSNGDRAVWLVKLPQFLAERWRDVDEDEEIVLGTVKVDRNAPDQKNVCPVSPGGAWGDFGACS